MLEAVIEEMAEASKQIAKDALNPFKKQVGECLLEDVERNFSGFLVRKEAVPFKVNSGKLVARIARLKDQILIAKFVGPKPAPQTMER